MDAAAAEIEARQEFVDDERREAIDDILELEAEARRRRWADDPVAWAEERLGVFLWSAQRRILKSVKNHRKTSVMSCHEVGKSFCAAHVAAWWIDTHPPGTAFVVTTAPTKRQVVEVLWHEINRVHAKGLAGRTTQTQWYMNVDGVEELVAVGYKPANYDPTAFQGRHRPFMLVIGDEACGIPQSILTAMLTLMANDTGRMLLLGNPDDQATAFAKTCKPGSGFNVIRISAFDTPCFTGEDVPADVLPSLVGRIYVEDARESWASDWEWVDADGVPADSKVGVSVRPPQGADAAETHPFWQSKVLGLFPQTQAEGTLILMAWIRAAQEREMDPVGPNEAGVDVGGGSDTSTMAHRRGPVVRIVHEDKDPNTMRTCGKVIAKRKSLGVTTVKIDKIGIGAGLVDRGLELKEPFVGINVGEAATEDGFVNLRAQYWWALREIFQGGMIDLDPDDEKTAAELCDVRYFYQSNGKVQIESKKDAKKRGVRSPNRGDAVMLAFAQPGPAETGATGGLVW